MDELFHVTFAALRTRVVEGPRHCTPPEQPIPPIPFAHSLDSSPNHLHHGVETKHHLSDERSHIQEKLKKWRDKKHLKVKEISKYLTESEEILNLISNNQVSAKSGCQKHFNYTLKQLNSQNTLAERRMRELVFEVMGEYGKCALRSTRRHAYLRCSYRIQKAVIIFHMRWNYFMGRLVYEAIQQQCVEDSYKFEKCLEMNLNQHSHVCPLSNKEEFSRIRRVVSSILSATPSRDLMVSMVVKFVTPEPQPPAGASSSSSSSSATASSHTPRGQRRAARQASSPVLATSVHDLRKLVHEATRYVHMGMGSGTGQGQGQGSAVRPASASRRPQPHSTSTSTSTHPDNPTCCSTTLLSAASIEWLRPCSYHPLSADTLVALFSFVPPPTPALASSPSKSSAVHASRRPQSAAIASAMATPNQFDSFSHRFLSQHGALSNSNHVYFCLEERACSGGSSGGSRGAEEATAGLHLLSYLQVSG